MASWLNLWVWLLHSLQLSLLVVVGFKCGKFVRRIGGNSRKNPPSFISVLAINPSSSHSGENNYK